MFDDDNDFFGSPDLDFDGDHDMVDDLLMLDIIEEEERELEKGSTPNNKEDYDWHDDYESGAEYGISPDDYDTREEFEEAIEEARAAFNYVDDIDDLNDAEMNSNAINIPITISFSFGAVDNPPKKQKKQKFKAVEEQPKLFNIEYRSDEARRILVKAERGYSYPKNVLKSCKFITEDASVASKYLTVRNKFLYVQAIKDNFKLPISVPDEHGGIKTTFLKFMKKLSKVDAELSLKVWAWCLDTFLPYLEYSKDTWITQSVFLDIEEFEKEFIYEIVEYMSKDTGFVENLFLKNVPIAPIDKILLAALELNRFDVAQKIITCVMDNQKLKIRDKISIIDSCVSQCVSLKNMAMSDAFQKNIFPILISKANERVNENLSYWESVLRDV